MPEARDGLVEVVRAIEALLRGATAWAEAVREQLETRDPDRAGAGDSGEGGDPFGIADRLREATAWGQSHALEPLRAALRKEVARWEGRALIDPAAARVHALVSTLLEILEEPEPVAESEPECPGPRSRGSGAGRPRR